MSAFKKFFGLEPIEQFEPIKQIREASADVIPMSYAQFVQANPKTMMRISSVYRSVEIISNMVSQLELETFDNGKVVASPPLIRKPDVNLPRKFFVQQTVTDMAMYGESFWKVHFDGRGAANNLEILNPDTVTVTKEDGVIGYSINGKRVPANTIRHLKLSRFSDELRGKGPIQVAKADFELALLLEDYAKTQFDAAGIPRGKLTSAQELNPEDMAEIAEGVRAFIDNNGGLMVLSHGLDYQQLVGDPTKTQFIEVQKMVDLKIARSFGVPAEALFMPIEGGSGTYQNVSQSNLRFLQSTLNRYLDEIEEHLSEFLPTGKTVKFREEDLMRLDILGKWQVYEIQHRIGYTSGDELRADEGKAPLPKPVEKIEDNSNKKENDEQ